MSNKVRTVCEADHWIFGNLDTGEMFRYPSGLDTNIYMKISIDGTTQKAVLLTTGIVYSICQDKPVQLISRNEVVHIKSV